MNYNMINSFSQIHVGFVRQCKILATGLYLVMLPDLMLILSSCSVS